MEEIKQIKTKNGVIKLITEHQVILFHHLISKYSTKSSDDKIENMGVKEPGLLSSAVHRQLIGTSGQYKYDTVLLNCATLLFGIIKNHPFSDGNKRTAFLSMIKHLHINGYHLYKVNDNDIIQFLLAIGQNEEGFIEYSNDTFGYQEFNKPLVDSDYINVVDRFLRKHTKKKQSYSYPLRFSKLCSSLKALGLSCSRDSQQLTICSTPMYQNIIKRLSLGAIYPNSKCVKYYVKDFNQIKRSRISQIRTDFQLDKDLFRDEYLYGDEDFEIGVLHEYQTLVKKLEMT